MRDGELHRETFAAQAAYLSRETRGLAGGDFWPCDYGPDLSRGFRALKVWFTFKVLGADAIGPRDRAQLRPGPRPAAPHRGRAGAGAAGARPAQHRLLPLSGRAGPADALNRAIVADLQEAGAVAPSLTTIDGKAAIRAALFNHRTEARDIEALVDGVLALGRARAAKEAAA